jgi:hypothetical protein
MYDDYAYTEEEIEMLRDMDFADSGGRSALRAATPDNPRVYPCPTCGAENRLTRKDVDLGYQCDICANRDERGY